MKGPKPKGDAVRFWNMVVKGAGCWIWQGSTIQAGHGQFGVKVMGKWRLVYAHRWAYETTHGTVPAGLKVLHHCDNPPCVRPDHLFVGTQADNMADMHAKGRWRSINPCRGQEHPQAKLTPVQVQEILASAVPHRALAAQYSISAAQIGRIKRRESWV